MTREEAIRTLKIYGAHFPPEKIEALDMAISALSAEPIERISDSTIKVEYKGYEDIGRIILTDEDIFCKIFYEDTKQKYEDDDNYDALIPDKYMTEPSDLISREEVKRVLRDVWVHDAKMPIGADPFLAFAMQDIENIPSVSAERVGEWIPCSEKLPTEHGKYLVTFSGYIIGKPYTNIAYYGNPFMPMNTSSKSEDWYVTDENGDYYIESVIAWQPLPKPYEARTENTK